MVLHAIRLVSWCSKQFPSNANANKDISKSPRDKMRDLKAQNYQHLREIVMLKKEVDKLKTTVYKWFAEKEMWEQEARSLWEEFVTEEKASSDFIWRARSKRYLVK